MNTQHMNDKLLTAQEAALAWAQGKRVEAICASHGKWIEIEPIGLVSHGLYLADVFSRPRSYQFRIVHETPGKKFRPYTREELAQHLGRRVQFKHSFGVGVLCQVDSRGNGLVGLNWLAASAMLESWEWVGGEPCGVEVGE